MHNTSTEGGKKLPWLRLNKKSVQKLSNTGETERDFETVLHPETSIRPKGGNVGLGNKTLHAQGGCNISTLIRGIARTAKNVVDRDMKSACRPLKSRRNCLLTPSA